MMNTRVIRFVAVGCVLTGLVSGPVPVTTCQEAQTNVSSQSVQQLVRDLGADSYQQREAATRQLIDVGAPAIGALAAAAVSDESEIAWRATDVLEQIGMNGNEAALIAVANEMNRISQSGRSDLARRSSMLRDKWKQARTERAVARMQEIGAQVIPTNMYGQVFRGGGIIFDGGVVAREVGPIFFGDDLGVRVVREIGMAEPVDALVDVLIDEAEIEVAEIEVAFGDVEVPDPVQVADPAEAPDSDSETKDGETTAEITDDNKDEQALEIASTDLDREIIEGPRRERQTEFQSRLQEVMAERREVTGLPEDDNQPTQEEIAMQRAVEAARLGMEDPFAQLQIPELPQVDIEPRAVVLDGFVEAPALEGFAFAAPVAVAHFGAIDAMGRPQAAQVARTVVLGQEWVGKTEDLRLLNQIQNITSVQVNGIDVTEEMLVELSLIDSLSSLNLNQASFDTNQVKALLRLKPGLTVTATGKAFLGINANLANQDGQTGCLVTNVIQPSGASAGGILMGDLIVRIDDQPIDDFVSLTLSVANREVGERVEVELMRDGQRVVTSAKLGSRDQVDP